MKIPTASIRDRLLPIALSQGMGLLCGIAGVKIVSSLVAPAAYGTYGIFLSLAPLGMWVVHAGLVKFVARHWAASPDVHALLSEVWRAGLRKAGWLALAVAIAAGIFFPDDWLAVTGLLLLSAALLSIGALAQAALQAARAHWADLGVSATASVSRTALPPLLYWVSGGSWLALLGGFAGHALLAAAAGWIVLRQRLRHSPRATGHCAPQLLPVYEGPLFMAPAIAGWALTAANRWIVAGFFGAEAAGFFTLAGNLSLVVTSMLGVIVAQYFQPGIFALPSATETERRLLARRIDTIALAYTLLALAGVTVLQAAMPWLTGTLIGENYAQATRHVAAVGCFGVAMITTQFFGMLLLAGKRERACAATELGSAAVLIAGGVISAACGGETWFFRWLMAAPLVPWLLSRTLARCAILGVPTARRGSRDG